MLFSRIFNIERRFESSDAMVQQQLLWTLLLRVILYTLLLGVNFFLQDEKFEVITIPPPILVLFLLSVYVITIGSSFLLLKIKYDFRRFGFIQCLIDTVFSSVLVYLSGASHSVFTSIYFFPIIAGGLLMPIKGGLISAAASTLSYGLVLVLEYNYFLPEHLVFYSFIGSQNILFSANHFAIKGLTFFLAAIISSLFGARLKLTTEALRSTRLDFDRLALLYKEIFDNIGTGIVTVNGDNTITSVNNATCQITGVSEAEMSGKNFSDFFPDINLSVQNPRNACDFERKDSQKIRLGYAHSSLNRPKRRKLDQDKDPSPNDQVSIITLKDISEIERLESQMRQAEKLAAIGMMSASIAHDFRNPLTAISGSAQILAQEFSAVAPKNNPNYELSKIILRESDRLIKTIGDFLKFARPESIDREWFYLLPCVNDILQVCKAAADWPPTCSFNIQIDPKFRVWADEKQFFTVISQLINNGISFCPKGSEQISIVADNRVGPNREEMHCITVSDNGPGVPVEEQRKIFEPFYTSRPDGTGLGLAIVRQTVEAHSGFIVVGSSESGGASFSVYLPIIGDT